MTGFSKAYLLTTFATTFAVCFLMIGSCSPSKAAEKTVGEDIGGEQGKNISIPTEIQPFIPSGFYPIYLKKADLNTDQLPDYLMVLEANIQKGAGTGNSDQDTEETDRPLIILQRNADGNLAKVKENDKIVYCRICGGIFGDPFEGIDLTEKSGFVVRLYGGSGWRWSSQYEFAYSRRDKTWQLIKVSESSFHASAPEDVDSKTYTPPKDFGKIDLADFDPDNFTYPDSSEPK